ncbi:MAG: FxsA family protein [Planctomycetota bacterium]
MPLLYLLMLFTVLPLVEFSLLWQLAGGLGLGPTILLVLVTGVIGAWLAKAQGVMTLLRVQREMASGKMPADALFDGALILVAGAVLITPGILTDLFGFCLLIPPIRFVVKRGLMAWAKRNVRVEVSSFGAAPQATRRDDSVIDVHATGTRVEDP